MLVKPKLHHSKIACFLNTQNCHYLHLAKKKKYHFSRSKTAIKNAGDIFINEYLVKLLRPKLHKIFKNVRCQNCIFTTCLERLFDKIKCTFRKRSTFVVTVQTLNSDIFAFFANLVSGEFHPLPKIKC